MYLRFISPWRSDLRNVDYGIFQAAYICRDQDLVPDYILDPLLVEIEWFKKHLPSPDEDNFDYAGHNVGICWFRNDAKSMIRRARRMVDILRAADIWISVLSTQDPGDILYSDEYQIIAKPGRKTPTHWGQFKQAAYID